MSALNLKRRRDNSKQIRISDFKTTKISIQQREQKAKLKSPNKSFIKCDLCCKPITTINSESLDCFQCKNCFRKYDKKCDLFIKKFAATNFEQNNSKKKINLKNELCFGCFDENFQQIAFKKQRCSFCFLENYGNHLVCKLAYFCYRDQFKELLHFGSRTKKCHLCENNSKHKNLLKCNYNETECARFFHLSCALESKQFHWISFRNNLSNSAKIEFAEPILRCALHSDRKVIAESMPRPILKGDSFPSNLDIFDLTANNFVFDQLTNSGNKLNSETRCSVCYSPVHFDRDFFVFCSNPFCEIAVHQRCYGVSDEANDWFCDVCVAGEKSSAQCGRCSFKGGALKISQNGDWIHVACALLDGSVKIGNLFFMAEILPRNESEKNNKKKIENGAGKCFQCAGMDGKLISCSQKDCGKVFHALCALKNSVYCGFEFETKLPKRHLETALDQYCVTPLIGQKSSKNGFVYCSEHSPENFDCDQKWHFLPSLSSDTFSQSPIKRFFEMNLIKEETNVRKQLNFKQPSKVEKDELRFEHKLSKSDNIGKVLLIEEICKIDAKMSKTFKNNKELLKSGNLEKFLQIFDEKTDFLVTKKINSIYNELKFETSNLWENRCANTKCLKTSKFQSFCDKCGNAQTLQKIKSEQKEIGLNFNFSQNEKIKMIEKSFDIILEMTRKQKSKNKIRRNGGDIVFLLRNVLINASAKIKKTTKLAFDEIMKKIRKVTKLHDNSNPSELLVNLEMIHAMSSVGDENVGELKEQIKRSLAKTRGSVIVFSSIKNNVPPFISTKNCTKCNLKYVKSNCRKCRQKPQHTIDIDSICSSMIWLSVFGDLEIPFVSKGLKARLFDVLKIVKTFVRPYRSKRVLGEILFKKQCYLVTHLVFIVSNGVEKSSWGRNRVDYRIMTEEFLFLVVNLRVVVELKDPELVGEFLQCLRIFNVPENSNLIKLGVNYLIGSVKRGKRFRKGGWVNTTNFYTKYHAAYCAIVGLADDKLFQFVKMIGKNSEWDFILND